MGDGMTDEGGCADGSTVGVLTALGAPGRLETGTVRGALATAGMLAGFTGS